MIRRSALLAALAILTGGLAAPALAAAPHENGHGFCVGASDSNRGQLDGICVWIPTH
ncbi:MAG: hypothetical protein JWN87_988 [Frankiales bacterium]|jgi:hypothetical protein|nr:hypothetical protein [Frankiales bacterium]